MERIKSAIGESLMANKSVLLASLRQEFGRRGSKDARRAVSEWLDEIVGDVLTDVAEEVYSDLPDIADALVEETAPAQPEEEPVVGQDDEEEDVEVDEELDEEPEEGDFEPESEAGCWWSPRRCRVPPYGVGATVVVASGGPTSVGPPLAVSIMRSVTDPTDQ
jgi:hypothetical protein